MNETIRAIQLAARKRQQIVSAHVRAGNQIKALGRRALGKSAFRGKLAVTMTPEELDVAKAVADAVQPVLTQVLALLVKERRAIEKELVALAKQLPAWTWVESVRGVGPLGLALIVGETGDLAGYGGPARLWKRLGLAVIDGERQRRVAKDADLAIRMGYNPRRRALAYVMSEAMLKQNDGEYRAVYDARKVLESAKLAGEKTAKGHAHKRAMRFMFKRFVRDLWCVWNGKALTLDVNVAA
jgi:hypothetical protein